MRQHSALNRDLMFEWLKDLDDTGDRCPSDDAIMERFDFDTPEQARTLLADLADKGLITVRGGGADRVVTIRGGARIAAPPPPVERPVPSIVKPDPEVEATTNRILEIVGRCPSVVSPAPRPVEPTGYFEPRPEPRPATLIVAEPVEHAAIVAPDPRAKGKGGRRPRGPSPLTRQINCRATEETYRLLQERAAAERWPITTLVGDIVAREVREEPGTAEPIHKPLVRAHVIRAARAAGIPIEEFVAGLIECGLQRFLADQSQEIAA